MILRRVFLAVGGIWELTRYTFIFLIVAGSFNAALGANYNPVFLWLGSGHLVVAAAFLFIAAFPKKYGMYRPMLLIGKGIGMAGESFLLISREFILSKITRLLAVGPTVLPSYAQFSREVTVVAGAILVLDLIFFLFLVSYREDRHSTKTRNASETGNLPDFSDWNIEEE